MQFDRDYQLTIEYDGVNVLIQPPMRVVFDVFRSIDGSGLNKATISVYNLKESTRAKIEKSAEDTRKIKVKLITGYKSGDNRLRQIFDGLVMLGHTERDGVDFVTKMESYDGMNDLFYGYVAKTVKTKQQSLNRALSDMGLSKGIVTNLADLTRPKVMFGKSTKVIESFLTDTNQSWFIKDGKLNIINGNEVLDGYIPVISPESGLISTPTRQQQIITFDTLMNASIELGGMIDLQSTTGFHVNGKHKVVTIETRGDYMGNDWVMTVVCRLGDYVKAIST